MELRAAGECPSCGFNPTLSPRKLSFSEWSKAYLVNYYFCF